VKPSELTKNLLAWYADNSRNLPWRNNPDPYAVWVSEIMLQQTRVETVIPYYESWMTHFPTLSSLAEASQQQVLTIWEGLGYYSRARNLHRAAQIVVNEMGAEIPQDVKSLQKLPGIGSYTAGAIASIAFGLDEPALDGNIRRVLSRVFDVREPARSPEGEHKLWKLATENLPIGKASDYNQALMDLGSLVCTPKSPDCPECPLIDLCQAHALGVQEERPVSKPKPKIPHHTVTAAVIQQQGKVLITQRPPDGLLGGLWEFPGGKLEGGESLQDCLKREICEELGIQINVGAHLGEYQHAYTHFRVTLHAFDCELKNGKKPEPIQVHDLRWVYPMQLGDYPMGKIDRQISIHIISQKTSQKTSQETSI
jgi:A/G-specific adenine glycosylase